MKTLPYLILEVANVHGGSIDNIKRLIDHYQDLNYEKVGIKFQPFKYETLALEDFSWYKTYKELYIEEDAWKDIVAYAREKIGDVWFDVGDTYAIQNLSNNLDFITGIKLQASALENYEILSALKKVNISGKKLIVNISGYSLESILDILPELTLLGFKETILQIGFQNYPTQLKDTSLAKIKKASEHFPGYQFCYADHIDAASVFAQDFPAYAFIMGCTYIEKHVCVRRMESKYDADSALELEELLSMVGKIQNVAQCFPKEFVVDNEKSYLDKIMQKPVLAKNMKKGQLVSKEDIIYRRTDQEGLLWSEIQNIQKKRFILNKDLKKFTTIKKEDYKKARIGICVACRLKSSRLKRKAILPIQGMPSVERCLETALKTSVDEVILTTSTLESDAELTGYTLQGRAKFWKGDPDDVISRFVGACDTHNLDVVLRVTADCPIVSSEVVNMVIDSHFEKGSDFSVSNRDQIMPGIVNEVYNVEVLKRILSYIEKAHLSEYMNAYVENNPHMFKINVVPIPELYKRDYRIVLDYQEDLEMLNRLYEEFKKNNYEISLMNALKVLDAHPEIAEINQECSMAYHRDQELIDKINRETRIHFEESKEYIC